MRFIKIFFVLLSSSIIGNRCQIDDESSGEGNLMLDRSIFAALDGRIVNGTRASIGQFPHLVSLRRSYSDGHFCGGSIIHEEWILTAAHCMFQYGNKILPWSISVIAGQLKLFPAHKFSQKRSVSAIIMHPSYDHETLNNDVALLKLSTALDLNVPYVSAAKFQETMPKTGSLCQVSGWGYLTEVDHVVSNHLMYVSLPLVSQKRCQELMINITIIPPGMICAGYEEGLRDACQGDSGGSMMCNNYLTGVVSTGEGCARPGLPGLYTKVPYYIDWIRDQMTNFNEIIEEDENDDYPLRFLGKRLR